MKLLIFLLLFARSYGDHYNNTRLSDQMAAFLTKLCPRSNICRANDSLIDEGYGPESMFRSCCTDCSCKSGCDDTNDCCFAPTPELHVPNCSSSGFPPSEDKAKIQRQCIYPKSGGSKPTDALTVRSYYMVTSEHACGALHPNEDCGNQKVAPWGNLHPVFSKRTGKIYKNKVCANAHNITDGVVWDAILACKIFDSNTTCDYDIIDFFDDLERGEVSSDCHVQFSYPGDLNEISSQICYRDMIDECTSTEFQVPSYLNATTEEITESCQSGLLSPYFDIERLYANVFCYICSGLDFIAEDKCTKFPDGKGGNGPDEFFSLLNMYEIPEKMDAHNKEQMLMACPVDRQHKCRPLLCSSGKIRNAMGDCIFPTKVWYRQYYTVALELNSEQEIDMEEAFPLENEQKYVLGIDALYLSSDLYLKRWSVFQLYYETKTRHENDTTTHTLVVFLTQYFTAANPVSLMNSIAMLMKTKWFLKYKNETLLLDPSPFKHKVLRYVDGSLSLTPGSFTFNSTFSLKSPNYRLIYRTEKWLNMGFLVTKLHFCEQIELVSEEYMLSADQSILYNKVSHQYLFDGEFSLMHSSSEGSVRICYENSGFVKTNVAICASAKSNLIAALVVLVLISWST